jgi:hypothetical protein
MNLGKKATEDLLKDIWASKELKEKASRHLLSLQDYTSLYLQNHYGQDAVVMGYNILHSCHKYRYDPDCEVFLQVSCQWRGFELLDFLGFSWSLPVRAVGDLVKLALCHAFRRWMAESAKTSTWNSTPCWKCFLGSCRCWMS